MKISLSILALALFAFFSASAQVSVDVTMDQKQFLSSEAVPVAVHITNRSGQSLHLGADAGWLTFDVESADGFIVLKNADVPVIGAFDVGSSQVATKRVDLAPYFVLSKPGRYRVIATVRIKAWNVEINSSPLKFDVISGAKLASQDFGVPAPAGMTNTLPDVRKYNLIEANYLESQLRLYVQVTDESESRVFNVTPIGKLISFSTPETQLDRHSNFHVLWQSNASSFTYTEVNPNGQILRQETYDYVTTRPRLGLSATGDVQVVGGVRRLSSNELPVVKMPDQPVAPVNP